MKKEDAPARSILFSFLLYSHTGSHAEGSGNSGQYGNDDVENFSPDRFVFHEFLSYKL